MSKKLNPTSGTATFRLGSGVLDELHQEAEQKRTSLNTLVSQVLQSHTEYHTFAARAGMVSVPKSLLISLIDSVRTSQQQDQEKNEEESISRLSKQHIARNEFKDTVLLMKGSYTAESVIDFIESWARANGFPYRHYTNNYRNMPDKSEDNYSEDVNVVRQKGSSNNNNYNFFKGNSNDDSYDLSITNDNKIKAARHSFVIQHDMGERWSLYFVELFKFAFEQLGIKVNSAYTANTISLEM